MKSETNTKSVDGELKELALLKEYHKLIEKELATSAEEFVRKPSLNSSKPNESSKEMVKVVKEMVEISNKDLFIDERKLENKDELECNLLVDLPKDMSLAQRRKLEADTLLATSKPFLMNLATSEIKDALDERIIDDLQKFVMLADKYLLLINPTIEEKKNQNVKFNNEINNSNSNNNNNNNNNDKKDVFISKESQSQRSKGSIVFRNDVKEEDKSTSVFDKTIEDGLNNNILTRTSKTTNGMQIIHSKRPSQVFAELKATKMQSFLRKKKSIIKKILYPIEASPLVEPEAHLLDIEQQLNLCLPLPMQLGHLSIPTKTNVAKIQNGENQVRNDTFSEELTKLLNGGEVKDVDEIHKEYDFDAQVVEQESEEEEEEEESDEVICKRMHCHGDLIKHEEKERKVYDIIKGDWTCAITYEIMEYFYTERCHVPCHNVASLWVASNEIMLQSLTNLIFYHPLEEYLRLALRNETNRTSLLRLAVLSCKSTLGSSVYIETLR